MHQSKIFLFLCLIFLTHISLAQKGQITGTLTDTSGKKPIVFATVTLFNAKDTSIITYRLSDDQGKFKVPSLPLQTPLRAVITASGFSVLRKEFSLTEASPVLDLGITKMSNDIKELEEVLILAERPPVVVRRDTIEFNAAAFKTLPTALVEDLLKKMPGVDVDKSGNIMVNGRRVNRLLVEGKEFFGSDPKIASKNLPADLIDKVQVTDDKEELDRNPDMNPSQLGQVINLKLKKSIKQGWFGKLYAGAGTQDRFEAGGIVNMFRDTLQVSLVGFTNNLSRSGFSIQDIMNIGGFSRSNINSLAFNSDGSFSLNDISFGGMSGTGIQRSSGVGVNANTLLGKRTTLSMQYFYGENKMLTGRINNTEQFFNDTVLTTRSVNTGESADKSHRFSGMIKVKTDTLSSTFEYRPSFSFVNSDNTSSTQINSFSNYDPLLNESINEQRRKGDGFSTNHELSYTKRFRKKGRALFTTLSVRHNTEDAPQFTDAENTFHKTSSTTSLRQLRDQALQSTEGRFYMNFGESLSKSLRLRLFNTLEYFNNRDYIDTYEYDPAVQQYTIPDPSLTNGLQRRGWRNNASASIFYNKKIMIVSGLSLRTLDIDNEFRKDPSIKQRFTYLLPSIAITIKQWIISANMDVREPNITDLQPVTNNTNPLYLTLGNPELQPTISRRIDVSSYFNNAGKQLTYSLNGGFMASNDAVIRERFINEDGVQVSRPINIDGILTYSLNGNIRKQYKFSNILKFSAGLNLNASYTRSFVIVNQNRSESKILTFNPRANVSFNWSDKVELNQIYTPSFNKSTYENAGYPSLKAWRHNSNTELVVRAPKHLVWESSLDYLYNPQVAPGIQKSAFRWNAAINVLFLKEDKGQLKLSVYDLLNQNISVTRTVRENYIQDTETIILRRYFLLTFTYNIRNFGGKVGGRNSLLSF